MGNVAMKATESVSSHCNLSRGRKSKELPRTGGAWNKTATVADF